MNRLLSILQDENGQLSTMRVGLLIIVLCFATEWQYAIWSGAVTQPAEGLTGYVPDVKTLVAIFGAFGFKTLQKPFERKAGTV